MKQTNCKIRDAENEKEYAKDTAEIVFWLAHKIGETSMKVISSQKTNKEKDYHVIRPANARDFRDYPPTDFKVEEMDRYLQHVWNELSDIPFDETEDTDLVLAIPWWGFEKGTDREDIWHFFDQWHSRGVAYLLYKIC